MDIEKKLLGALADLHAGRLAQANTACNEVLSFQPNQPNALHILAIMANQQKDYHRALVLANTSLSVDPNNVNCLLDKAQAQAALGENEGALATCHKALTFNPDNARAHCLMSELYMPGESYLDVISRFHQWLQPKSYLEVGVNVGNSILLVNPPTVAVGIDPVPSLKAPARATTKLFPMYSDDYFAMRDVRQDLEHNTIDFSFIDGLHLYEQALRDFINIEKYASSRSVVVMHDLLPINRLTAARERKTSFWSGDVWKVSATLIKHRPDLEVFTVAAHPTGLGVITGLDPLSTVLTDNFDAIVREFVDKEVPEDMTERRTLLRVVDNDWDKIQLRLAQRRR